MIDILTIILSVSVSIADTISNLFRIPGQLMREILLSIDLHIAKSLFIIYFYWPLGRCIFNNLFCFFL